MQLAVGTVVDGKYQIADFLGAGGAGTVYLAYQQELGRKVAIKILNTTLLGQQYSRQRFDREAKLLSSLEHKHLVKLYAIGLYAESIPYLVAEYLDGSTLAEELAREKCFDWQRALNLGVQVCLALEYVHSKGIIHRDLKPQNIMFVKGFSEDFVKVLDFGLAKTFDADTSSTITRTGEVIGSTHYLSPEQCSGKKADKRSDIYSLACLLYECICGRPPFVGEHPIRLLYQHSNEQARPPSEFVTGQTMPPSLDRVLLKALQKDPEQRYQSMREFADALKELLLGSTVKVDLAEFDRGKPKFSFALFVPVALAVFILVTVASLVIWKQEKLNQQIKPAESPLDEVSHLLADPGLSSTGNKALVSKEILRTLRSLIHALSFCRPDGEIPDQALSLMDKFVAIYQKADLTSSERTQMVELVHNSIEFEAKKANRYNEGLLLWFWAKMLGVKSDSNVGHVSKASICFASGGNRKLAELALSEVKERSPEHPRSILIDFSTTAIEYYDGNKEPFRKLSLSLPARVSQMPDDSTKIHLLLDVIELGKKENDWKLLEYAYTVVGYYKATGDGIYKVTLVPLAEMLLKQGRIEEARKTYNRLYDCAIDHGNLELEELAKAGMRKVEKQAASLRSQT